MYYEEKVVDGVIFYRTNPVGEWRMLRLVEPEKVSEEVLEHAMKLYSKHIGCTMAAAKGFMWKQCSADYREAWLTIAVADFEGFIDE